MAKERGEVISLIQRIVFLLLLLVTTSSLPVVHAASNDALAQAYKLRSSKPQQAAQLFDTVDKSTLSKDDQELYDYTHAYLKLVMGDIAASVPAFNDLTSPSYSFNLRFKAYSALAAINAATQNWVAAFEAMDFLTENIEQVDDSETKEQGHNAIINFYNSIDEKETVISYANSIVNGQYSTRFTCLLNMQLIVALVSTKNESLSESSFERALTFCKTAEEPIAINAINTHHAIYLYDQGKTEDALSVLLQQRSDVESTNYAPILEEFYALLSKVYFLRKEYDKAKEYAYKVINEDKGADYAVISDIDAYEVLYKIAEAEQFYEQALVLYKSYAKAKSLNLSSMNAKRLSIHKAQQDNLLKSNQIDLLDAENSLLRAKARLSYEESNKRKLLFLGLFILFLFVVLWLYKKRSHYLELERISQKDSLTGIANRHFFTKKAVKILESLSAKEIPVSLVIFDLDDFKKINDSYGHKMGDIALKTAILAVQAGCRKGDFIGRLGGEEFGIIMSDCNLEQAIEIAERCRHEIELTNKSQGQVFSLTASFGVASSEHVGYDFEELFEVSDSALYDSKKHGKNKVCTQFSNYR
ncbi:GGDEF domain-containing protein [Pseudoalteromonas sp. MMG010]|uniref:GGDEF domain-containing protein n=1 Tax=Pseudoalteromonas sp. MMG010 TaxID=2822685 RepID=UPI001B3A6988|nr:GGDEF domain-containing protein [Pseudoalteromonas sp. MMG010]MBQ4832087.1 GGDEF domain-containing protein [Pseudoalteromonas sp. MMG010]